MILVLAAVQAAEKVALYGGGANPFAPSQAAPVDAVQVLVKDPLLEALAGSLEGLNAWNLLLKETAAIQTPAPA